MRHAAVLAALLAATPALADTIRFDSPAVTTLRRSGATNQKADLVFVGEGYRRSEMSAYARDVRQVYDYMFGTVSPYATQRSSFNVYRVNVLSNDSGADTGSGNKVNTAFNCTYNGRLLYVRDFANLGTARSKAPAADVVIVLVNHGRYGGSGGPGVAVSYHGDNMRRVTVHEFGHSFGSLADEYSYRDARYAGAEPSQANATKVTNRSQVKWKAFLGRDGVGIYQGALDYQRGVYRPTTNRCMMRELKDAYCAVCRAQILRKIRALSP